MPIAYTVCADLKPQDIADLVTTAFEGGVNYWLPRADLVHRTGQQAEEPWYADPTLYEGEFQMRLVEDCGEGDDPEVHFLTQAGIQFGLSVMATKYRKFLADILTENYDAETADVFLQCCLFQEIRYG